MECESLCTLLNKNPINKAFFHTLYSLKNVSLKRTFSFFKVTTLQTPLVDLLRKALRLLSRRFSCLRYAYGRTVGVLVPQ